MLTDNSQLETFEEGDRVTVRYSDRRGDRPRTKERTFTVERRTRHGGLVLVSGNRYYSVTASLGLRLKSTKTYQTDTSIGNVYSVEHAD